MAYQVCGCWVFAEGHQPAFQTENTIRSIQDQKVEESRRYEELHVYWAGHVHERELLSSREDMLQAIDDIQEHVL